MQWRARYAVIATAKGLNRAEVAKGLQISAMALFNKIHNKTEFKASEIEALKQALHLSNEQRDKIFFAAESTKAESTKAESTKEE